MKKIFFYESMAFFTKIILLAVVILFSYTSFISNSFANTHSVDLELDQNQSLIISDEEQTRLDLNSSFTLEAWVKLESYPSDGTWSTIVGKSRGGSSPDRSYAWYIQNKYGDKRILLEVHDNNTVSGSQENSIIYDLPVGEWHHLAVTYDLSLGLATFYVDGVIAGTSSGGATGLINNSAQPFQIGKLYDVDPYTFDGLIDEVRVWNIVRSQDEIAHNFMKELDSTDTTGLVGYWNFNETTSDNSSKNNNLVGNPSTVYSEDVPFGFLPEKTVGELVGELKLYVNDSVERKALRGLYLTHLAVFEKLYGKVRERVSVNHLQILKKQVLHDSKKKYIPQAVGDEIIARIDALLALITTT